MEISYHVLQVPLDLFLPVDFAKLSMGHDALGMTYRSTMEKLRTALGHDPCALAIKEAVALLGKQASNLTSPQAAAVSGPLHHSDYYY